MADEERVPRRNEAVVDGDAEPGVWTVEVSMKDHRQVMFHHVDDVQEVLLGKRWCHDAVEILPQDNGAPWNRQ